MSGKSQNNQLGATYDVQIGSEVKFRPVTWLVQWGVVVGSWFVRRMIIIGEQVEKVQMLVQGFNIEAFARVLQRGWHRHGYEQSRLARLLGLGLEGLTHFHHELCVIVAIFRFATITERGVFPIQIQTVKVVLPQELQRAPDEGLPSFRIRDQRAESSGAFIPASNGDQGLQVSVVRFQGRELAITS